MRKYCGGEEKLVSRDCDVMYRVTINDSFVLKKSVLKTNESFIVTLYLHVLSLATYEVVFFLIPLSCLYECVLIGGTNLINI
jgi:hypothetical protein